MLSVKRITTNLLQALIAFNLTTRPIAIIGTRRYKKEMLDMPSSTHPDKTFSFAIVSEMWDVITLAYYSESNTPSK
jgi:hypothetical protein